MHAVTGNPFAVDEDFTGPDFIKTAYGIEHCRLAAAGFTEERYETLVGK